MEQPFFTPSVQRRVTSYVVPSWSMRAFGRPTIATPRTANVASSISASEKT